MVSNKKAWRNELIHTKGIAVANLCPPTPDQIHLVLWGIGHLGIPLADKLDILVNLVGLDFVKYNRVDVLATGKDLTEACFELGVKLAALLGAVNEVGQRACLAGWLGLLGRFGSSYRVIL